MTCPINQMYFSVWIHCSVEVNFKHSIYFWNQYSRPHSLQDMQTSVVSPYLHSHYVTGAQSRMQSMRTRLKGIQFDKNKHKGKPYTLLDGERIASFNDVIKIQTW